MLCVIKFKFHTELFTRNGKEKQEEEDEDGEAESIYLFLHECSLSE